MEKKYSLEAIKPRAQSTKNNNKNFLGCLISQQCDPNSSFFQTCRKVVLY